MAKLNVNIAGVEFKNPLIAASGCFGFGREYEKLYDLSVWGGISLKGITLEPREGNPPPRIAETASGMLNSVGLQNPGVKSFLNDELPDIENCGTVLIANASGSAIKDYCETVELLSESSIDMIELNISCPNVKSGGLAYGVSCEATGQIVSAVRPLCRKPLIVKLSPNVTDIVSIAKTAQDCGADALSLINTLMGMRIDTETRRPVLKNNTGGLSGPAVFPVALRMVWQTASAVDIPVIGLGGISTARDVVEMMMAGAAAVQIGAALFSDPYLPTRLPKELSDWCDSHDVKEISEIVGTVEKW
jgi:dihydroorotate dehydrogenase (NAD+) catalytic subunit